MAALWVGLCAGPEFRDFPPWMEWEAQVSDFMGISRVDLVMADN